MCYAGRAETPQSDESSHGVCLIFLRVDGSVNEIHKAKALFSMKNFYKKYVSIYY
jgi:hypothetical protein